MISLTTEQIASLGDLVPTAVQSVIDFVLILIVPIGAYLGAIGAFRFFRSFFLRKRVV